MERGGGISRIAQNMSSNTGGIITKLTIREQFEKENPFKVNGGRNE